MTALHPDNLSARSLFGAMVAVAAVSLVMSGCAVGPNVHRPVAPTVTDYTREPLPAKTVSTDVPGGEGQRFVEGQDISHAWWALFQSPALNTLIEKALKTNPTIPAAQAALRQAIELVYAQRGAFYPTAQASFSPSRQQASKTFSSPLSTTTNLTYNLYTTQVTVGFVPDVFGGNRRQVESLLGLAEAQRFQLEATYVTLTSNVVAAAIQEASLRGQIAATKDIIAIATKSLELLRRQFALGYVTRLDVAAQEAALAQVEQTLPPLEKQLAQTRDLLTTLAGRFPSDAPAETFELAALHLPEELPVSLPSQLVEQRPDVRSAEAQLHATSAQIGVALANRLPQFTISAAYGGVSNMLTEMFAAGNPFWSFAGSITQSLFDAGTLKHRQRAAEAAFEQASAQYRGTVLTAFQNVADTLYALQHDAESLNKADAAERAALVTLNLTQRQLELGYVNYLALLSAEQAYQQALLTRVQAQAGRYTDTAALFQALGGGWWNRPSDAAAQPAAQPVERR